ncbi:MAG: hypothetical protein PF483_07260, partial [Halothiobacillus sp.]|nr:hypothetical protein [Halothiobacillus sp.]
NQREGHPTYALSVRKRPESPRPGSGGLSTVHPWTDAKLTGIGQAPRRVAFSLLRASCPSPFGPASLFALLLQRSGYFLLATQEKVTRAPQAHESSCFTENSVHWIAGSAVNEPDPIFLLLLLQRSGDFLLAIQDKVTRALQAHESPCFTENSARGIGSSPVSEPDRTQ